MDKTRPVLVVGAGPTGMTAAMELSRLGVAVRLVDRLLEPSTTSRALAVQARTLELLEPRGLTGEMRRIGNIGRAATIYGDGGVLGRVDLSLIESRYNYILLLSQAETERLLREQLGRQGVAIERGTELIAFAQSDETGERADGWVTAVLRDREGRLEELEAAYVISAEGAHSLMRHTLGLGFKGKALGESYALADLYLDGAIPDDELSIFTGDDGFLAVFPMGNRHFRFIASTAHGEAERSAEPTLEELQALYERRSHVPVRLRDMTWSSRFRINSRMLERLRVGRVFFAGDSAHIHSPAGGQGMNTGIQDMINLGWKLAMVVKGQASPALLDTYEEDRLPVIRGVVSKTEAATDVLNSESALVHGLIKHVAPLLLHRGFVQHMGTGMIGEVAWGYRASSLSETAQAAGELKAGDRLPDLEVTVAGGRYGEVRTVRMYELLELSRCTLLVVRAQGSGLAWAGEVQPWGEVLTTHVVSGESRALRALLGEGGRLVVVRPDAYVGWVGFEEDLPALLSWLGRWFPVRV